MKIKSLIFCLISILALTSIPAFTADYDVNSSGGNGTTHVNLTCEASTFSVTLPTSFPISVASDGTVTVSDSGKIINNCNGPIVIESIDFGGANDWEFVGPDDSELGVMDGKFFYLSITDIHSDNPITADGHGPGPISVSYEAKVAPQSLNINSAIIGSVTFTVAWCKSSGIG